MHKKSLYNKKIVNIQNDQNGQALLFVIVALTVGLAVGISTAFRTLSSVSRISTTDTSSRVLAAAEGGIEHFLAYSSADLYEKILRCYSLNYSDYASDPSSPCVVEFDPVATDNIDARSVVSVSEYTGDPDDNYIYRTSVAQGESATINLTGYAGTSGRSLRLCWSGPSDLFFVLYDANGAVSSWIQQVLCPVGTCISGSTNALGIGIKHATNCATYAGPGFQGYEITVPYSSTSALMQKGLTVIPLNSRVDLAFVPLASGSEFSTLGFLIASKGELVEDSVVKTTKTVKAVRTLPYMPMNFMFGLFADAGVSFGASAPIVTAPSCFDTNETCAADVDCCSNLCRSNRCVTCVSNGQTCTAVSQCCTGLSLGCSGGKCCTNINGACTTDSACCTGICYSGSCVLCKPLTASCSSTTECCTGALCTGGICTSSSSTCKRDGVSCSRNSDCCSNSCQFFRCAAVSNE